MDFQTAIVTNFCFPQNPSLLEGVLVEWFQQEENKLLPGLFDRGSLQGCIQTFWRSGGELPACQAHLQKGEEFMMMFKAAR